MLKLSGGTEYHTLSPRAVGANMTYKSTKTYGHAIGLSAAFRQWRADSHCKYLHGYALAVKFVFEAGELDSRDG
mgnify:CR=1 FL=1